MLTLINIHFNSKFRYYWLCLFTFSITVCNAQTELSKNDSFVEKVFLHTDRDYYTAGEDIWFKAYLYGAKTHQVTDHSNNLYVDLISAGDSIIYHRLIRLDSGTGHGDFKLAPNIKAGFYHIRAYTNWMRNYGDNFIYRKSVYISTTNTDISAIKTVSETDHLTNNSPASNSSFSGINLQFFPEGGSLVEGIACKVGVKAESISNVSLAAKCAVISSQGDTVTQFSCDSLGFGLFTLLPIKDVTYHAIVLTDRQLDKQALPVALNTGLSMRIDRLQSSIRVIVNSSGYPLFNNPDASYSVSIANCDSIHYLKTFKLIGSYALLNIAEDDLPAGINRITLYDAGNKPHCERLIFIHRADNLLYSINANKSVYEAKEKATVSISLTDSRNQPLTGNFSMSVTDSRIKNLSSENIFTYLHLQSEIRGKVSHPGIYFDTTNTNRFKQLDLLLLTQGWRDFVWRRLADTLYNNKYAPEHGINVTGRVRATIRNKGLPKLNVSLFANKATGQKLFSTQTDSIGRFTIPNVVFYGYQNLNVNVKDFRGESKGWIQVDSLQMNAMPVANCYTCITDVQAVKGNEKVVSGQNTVIIPNAINLNAVYVKETPNRYRPYTETKYITAKEHKDYGTLVHYLLANLDGVGTVETGISRCGVVTGEVELTLKVLFPSPFGGGFSISGSYSDGSPLPDCTVGADFMSLPMTKIVKLTINRVTHEAGGRVFVVAKPGSLERKDYFSKTTADMEGYYKARVFYNPQNELKNPLPDVRNTVHWQPNIELDVNGKAIINYPNPTGKGNFNVVLQGIAGNGMPVVMKTTYTIR